MFFIARINLTREENLPLGGLVFVWLLVTFAISTGLLSFYLLKKITIDENKITLKFLFSRKEFCYRFHEIEGYNLLENLDKMGKYRHCCFQTLDKKIYMFGSREYRNYNELTNLIVNKCDVVNVNFYSNAKKLLSFFIVTGIVSILILWISIAF